MVSSLLFMPFTNDQLLEILEKHEYLTHEEIERAKKSALESRRHALQVVLDDELIDHDLIGQAVAEEYKVPYADLHANPPTKETLALISSDLAKKQRLVVFSQTTKKIVVTTDQPQEKELEKVIQGLFAKKKVEIAYSLSEDIDAVLASYRNSLKTRFQEILETSEHIAPDIIDQILSDAVSYQASDVHFEPQKTEVVVRFRIDGALREAGVLPKEGYDTVVNRIKVQSRLRIDDHFSAQDGSMRFEKDEHQVDLRTSIIPTVEGEKIVLRLLGTYVGNLSLDRLGLSDTNAELLKKTANKPFGMIIVTGPTGSGKTTTLYALIQLLNTMDINITTIEDPVEYKIGYVNQIQVNAQTNLTFAKGLRAIVRQDPDVILVGEIRDQETAEIAVNAALTGHLLLSTFHANDASTAVPRLLDMGVEPFLLSSTLEMVVSQRLVRRICASCRISVNYSFKELKQQLRNPEAYFDAKKPSTLYQGKGCETCSGTGYKGRTSLFELIAFTPELKQVILKRPSAQEIWGTARAQGAVSLFEDGLEKVKEGQTTLEELLRVAEEPPVRSSSRV